MVNIPGDVQGRLFSQLHLDDALVPTCVVGISNLELKRGKCGLQDVGLPLITSPLPILTTKSPRPTDESNLVPRVSSLAGTCLASRVGSDYGLGALVAGLARVLEIASIFDRNFLALGRTGASSLLGYSLGDAHGDSVFGGVQLLAEGACEYIGDQRLELVMGKEKSEGQEVTTNATGYYLKYQRGS